MQPQQQLPPIQPPDSTGSPPTTHDYLHPIVDKPTHAMTTKQVTIMFLSVLGVSLVAVITMLAVALMPAKQQVQTSTQVKQSTTAIHAPLTAKQTIDHVKVYFKGTAAAKSPIMTPVLAPGKSFYTVIPDVAPLTSVAGEIAPDKSDAQLASITKSMEYDKYTKREFQDGKNGTDYLADYTRDDVVCQVAVTKPKGANHWFEVRCLDIAQYAEYAMKQQPIAERYTSFTSSAAQYAFVGAPVVVASKISGYHRTDIATATVIEQRMTTVKNRSLFYQLPDGQWRYFKDYTSGIPLECESYDSVDIQSAFAEEPCRSISKRTMDTVTNPTIKKRN